MELLRYLDRSICAFILSVTNKNIPPSPGMQIYQCNAWIILLHMIIIIILTEKPLLWVKLVDFGQTNVLEVVIYKPVNILLLKLRLFLMSDVF